MSRSVSDLVFVATHRTGADENQHEVLDLAIIDANGTTLLHTAFVPEKLHTADPEMLDAVGFTSGDWAPSPFFRKKSRQVLGHLTGTAIAGHNTQLHMRFLNRLLRETFEAEGLEAPEIEERMGRIDTLFIDTATLAWEQIGLTDLEAACSYLRIPYELNHSALGDARASRALYEKLLRANRFKRWWWKWRAP